MYSNINANEILALADQEIRQAQSRLALRRLRFLINDVRKLAPMQKIRLGNLLRRSGDYRMCTKVLHSLVKSVQKSEVTELAKIEFSGALVQMGLTTEAREHLTPLEHHSEALLQLGLSYFQEWDHIKAIPYLERLVGRAGGSNDYAQLVAVANLLVAYSFGAPDKLKLEDLLQLQAQLKTVKATLLLGLISQMIGRYWMNCGEYGKAQEIFSSGLRQLSDVITFDHIILNKWNLVCETKATSNPEEKLASWKSLRKVAIEHQHFETIRECDYYCGELLRQPESLLFCYHGTPFEGYRSRWKELQVPMQTTDIGLSFSKHSTFKPIGPNKFKRLDHFIFSENFEAPGLIMKTFYALMSDFYRPMSLPRIYQFVYPNQYWNPDSSPIQVRQLLFRLRQVLNNNQCGFIICEDQGNYFLKFNRNQKIFSWNSNWRYQINSARSQLLEFFGNSAFSFLDFTKYPNIAGNSLRTQRRKIREILDQQVIEKVGHSRPSRFRVI